MESFADYDNDNPAPTGQDVTRRINPNVSLNKSFVDEHTVHRFVSNASNHLKDIYLKSFFLTDYTCSDYSVRSKHVRLIKV